MPWLTLIAFLELAYLPMSDMTAYAPPGRVYQNIGFSTEIYTEIQIMNHFFVGGDVRSFLWKAIDSKTFVPQRIFYGVMIGARFDPVEVGFRHYCTHPVVPYWAGENIIWEGGYEEVYLRIGNK